MTLCDGGETQCLCRKKEEWKDGADTTTFIQSLFFFFHTKKLYSFINNIFDSHTRKEKEKSVDYDWIVYKHRATQPTSEWPGSSGRMVFVHFISDCSVPASPYCHSIHSQVVTTDGSLSVCLYFYGERERLSDRMMKRNEPQRVRRCCVLQVGHHSPPKLRARPIFIWNEVP